MSKLEDDLHWENSRDETDRTSKVMIRLCPSGGFWRAYNMSAWLLLNLARKMKVHVSIHDGIKVAQVGFPTANVSNWLPRGFIFEVTDGGFAVMKPDGESHLPDIENMQPTYDQWFKSLEISPKQDKRKSARNTHIGSLMSETSLDENKLILQILSFPVEKRTPLECVLFISELKVKLTEMLSQRLTVPDSITGEYDGKTEQSNNDQKE